MEWWVDLWKQSYVCSQWSFLSLNLVRLQWNTCALTFWSPQDSIVGYLKVLPTLTSWLHTCYNHRQFYKVHSDQFIWVSLQFRLWKVLMPSSQWHITSLRWHLSLYAPKLTMWRNNNKWLWITIHQSEGPSRIRSSSSNFLQLTI